MISGIQQLLRQADQPNPEIRFFERERWKLPHDFFLLKAHGTAPTIICQGCAQACDMPVQRTPRNALAIVCDKAENLGIIPVEPIETQRWQFDCMALVNALNPAFNGRNPRMLAEQRLWQVGHYHEQLVFLMRGINWHDANTILQQHAFSLQQGIILCLTPAKNPPAMPCVALCDVCSIGANGSIKVDVEALAGFLPSQTTQKIAYRFQRKGDYWQIIFNGKEATIQHSDGFTYIAALMAQPHTVIHALELQHLTSKAPLATPRSLEADIIATSFKPQKIRDRKSIQALKDQLEHLQEIQADGERIALAQERLETVLASQKATFRDDGEKARDIVRKAINTATKQIEKHLPDCAIHLNRAIRKGYSPIYTPADSIRWQ